MPNKNTKADRAKLFMPFDALRGFQERLREKERIVVEKKTLSEYDCDEIQNILLSIKKMDLVHVVFYDYDEYVTLQGVVTKVDYDYGFIYIVNKRILLEKIIKISLLQHP